MILFLTALLAGLVSSGVPPERYQTDSYGTTFYLAPNVVEAVCRESNPRYPGTIFACTNTKRRAIILPNPCLYPGEYAQLTCHELGHINGWNTTHDN